MSSRSVMSSGRISLPDPLERVLSLREGSVRCPPDVEKALSSIPHFLARVTVPQPSVTTQSSGRFGHLNNTPRTVWRQTGEDGFETVPNGARRRGGGGGGHNRQHYSGQNYGSQSSTVMSSVPTVPRPEPTVARFTSASVKASGEVEDRMMARIKGKINKIGNSTYEATKAFMQQILSGDETEFLDEFMKFVFEKAATEAAYCALYARLLHELADEFSHIRVVMNRLFKDYLAIFTEVAVVPEEGTSVYRAFVEAQERKKFRRGYSQFVAELVKLGEADKESFGLMILQIVEVLENLHMSAENTLLCEEYIDCLNHMCLNASAVMVSASWSKGVLERITVLTKKPKTEVPGLTNKARFALMDLIDAASRGWK